MARDIGFELNGQPCSVSVPPMARLLDVLREDLGLTGTKEGCGEGECGACAVIVDGQLVCSCLVPMAQVAGTKVRTVEGLAVGAAEASRAGGDLHAIQQAFLQYGGAQCGICTPGMLLAAVHLLERVPEPGEDDVRQALAGNLCRYTDYTRIFEAVLAAARAARTGA